MNNNSSNFDMSGMYITSQDASLNGQNFSLDFNPNFNSEQGSSFTGSGYGTNSDYSSFAPLPNLQGYPIQPLPNDNSFGDLFADMTPIPQEMVPMQPQPQQQPVRAVPPPPTVPGTTPKYHAEIGWYFPAVNPGTETAPTSQPTQRTNHKRKQYLGPAAYFSDKSRSASTATPPTQRVKTDKVLKVRKVKTPKNFRGRGEKFPSIEQPCVCGVPTTKIPRPKNAFIIFRMQLNKKIRRNGTNDAPNISKVAGMQWKEIGPEGQAPYKRLAQIEAKRHAEMYPGYRFQPNRGTQLHAQFGDPTCTCGAYQVNAAKWKRERGDSPAFSESSESQDENGTGSEPDVLEDFANPTDAFPTQMAAPIAPAMGNMPDFDFSPFPSNTPAYTPTGYAPTAQMQAPQPAMPQMQPQQPLRRSSRNHGNPIYTTTATTPPSSTTAPFPYYDTTETTILASIETSPPPAPETLTAPTPHLEGKPKTRPTPISTPLNSPPAHNTRARSRSRSLSLELPPILENFSDDDFKTLFGEGALADWNAMDFVDFGVPDEDENIVVAAAARPRSCSAGRRPSSKGSSSGAGAGAGKGKTPEAGSPRMLRRSPRTSASPRGRVSAGSGAVEKQRRRSSSSVKAGLRRSGRSTPKN